jgi:phosphate transport system substrate-binding protein
MSLRSPTLIVALILAVTGAPPCEAEGRDNIVVVGSSTVFPFSTLVAEHFARSGPFQRPSVRVTSTGDGFKLFCRSPGADTPDISNASRRMTADERALCAANGVRKITEIRIGYDSLVVAGAATTPIFDMTLDQLWRAAAKVVPVNGVFVSNPYRQWSDIAPTLPNRPIMLFGPALGHGTRDALIELVMRPACMATGSNSRLPLEELARACSDVRDDGRWIDVDNTELTLGKLASHREALGILTYSYLELFPNRIHAATVHGVEPSRSTITSGRYPISRPLFIYVKEEHLRTTVGLADYTAEFVSFCAAGARGYLSDEGLVPLPGHELLDQRAIVARLQR